MPRIKSKQIIGERPTRPEHLTTKEYVDDILNMSSVEKRRMAYFHSLGKVMNSANQNINENKYKASHNIKINEIWTDSVVFADTFQTAYAESLTSTTLKFYNKVTLNEIYGSNNQTYCYIENGTFKDDSYHVNERGKLTTGSTFIRPLIAPEDIFDEITNEISYGYELKLYRGDDAISGTTGSEILPSDEWYVDYYSGTIHFTENNTPVDLGWGSIKASFFKYNGKFISNIYDNIFQSAIFENNTIIFNKNQTNEQVLDLSTLILNNTISNITLNNTKELVITKNDETIYKIDLKPIINDVVNNVSFNQLTNILTFYKNNVSFLSVDINDILSEYGSSFVDADIDLLNDQLLFTTLNGASYAIQLSQLQDRSAFNIVELNNNNLRFITQNGDVSNIDLSEIVLLNKITDVLFDNNIISFYKDGDAYLNINIDAIITQKIQDTNPIVDTTFDTLNNKIVFTYLNGSFDSIDIENLQDRTAYNDVVFNNNILKFTQQNGDIKEIDFSSFVDNNKITDVILSKDELVFYKNDVEYLFLDIKSIIDKAFNNYNPIVDVSFNSLTNEIIYTYFNGNETKISIQTLQDRTAFYRVNFNNNLLTFEQQTGDVTTVDLTTLVLEVGITDVQYNNVGKIVTFYKNNDVYLTLDLENIIGITGEPEAFVDADIDLLNDHLVFTKANGSTYTIQLSQLQDRSAFNTVELNNNILKFIKQDGDISIVELNHIDLADINPDIFIDANFNTSNSVLTFNLINGNLLNIDLSSLKTTGGSSGTVGLTSFFSNFNINMSSLNTTKTSNLACSIPLLSPNVEGSNVYVFLNGIQVVVGDDDECECYFSSDDGLTKNTLNNIKMGDKLYWNYVAGLPVSGYELSINDKLTFNYLNLK